MPDKLACDVVVVGTGGSALTSALSASENGAKVLVIDKAPKTGRGGNTYFAGGGVKVPYKDLKEIREFLPDLSEAEAGIVEIEPFTTDDYYSDFMSVTGGRADPQLIEVLTREANSTVRWLMRCGVKYDLYSETGHALRIGGKLIWPHGALVLGMKGGGAGYIDSMFPIIEARGIEVRYETKLVKLCQDKGGRITGLTVRDNEGFKELKCGAVILACGGFQANVEMRTRYLGKTWDVVKLRGTLYNTGDGIRAALDVGVQPVGQWGTCHAAPIDADAPDFADRTMSSRTVRRSYTLGISVNIEGKRFFDEGQDFDINTYSKVGAIISTQPRAMAFQIFDAKVEKLLEPMYVTGQRVSADTLEELADRLGLDPEPFLQTVREFNDAARPGTFDITKLDGNRTMGLTPPKSNWAQKIDTPPFFSYVATCGATFTYGGIKIDPQAQVLDTEDRPIAGLYATGEIVGGIYYGGYPAGSGLVDGATFGRIGGANAAREALRGKTA